MAPFPPVPTRLICSFSMLDRWTLPSYPCTGGGPAGVNGELLGPSESPGRGPPPHTLVVPVRYVVLLPAAAAFDPDTIATQHRILTDAFRGCVV